MEITITEYIPPYLVDYMRNFFKVKNQQWILTYENEIGKYFGSLLEESRTFPKPTKGITFIVRYDRGRNEVFQQNTISIRNQRKFIDYLQVRFNLTFFMWMVDARENGVDIITGIKIFMKAYAIDVDNKNVEALKKKYYRKRSEIRRKFREALQQLVY
jgi:hypothetical protein